MKQLSSSLNIKPHKKAFMGQAITETEGDNSIYKLTILSTILIYFNCNGQHYITIKTS